MRDLGDAKVPPFYLKFKIMPDISMCDNINCKLKENCYRFKAIPNKYHQSYNNFILDKKGNCKFYWKMNFKNPSLNQKK